MIVLYKHINLNDNKQPHCQSFQEANLKPGYYGQPHCQPYDLHNHFCNGYWLNKHCSYSFLKQPNFKSLLRAN